jgi:membrane-bound metal-dependent hydrolase YbcI (DUF457 family)
MNYIHHAIIGIGTAGLGLIVAESLGLASPSFLTLGFGALVVGTGSIATDLDHPRSFISNSIPTRVIRIALVILLIPLLAVLAALLTTHDTANTWTQFTGLVFGVNFLRWALIAFVVALGLMLLSWFLYKSLHHRGPLHSILFAMGITMFACLVLKGFAWPWAWGLVLGWGWLWHILADGLTEQGVPFFWPFSDERRHSLPVWACQVGRAVLSMMSVGGIIALVIFRISRYY